MKLVSGDSIDIGLLAGLFARPPLYERSDHYIWTDDHVGTQMLRFHLDPEMDSASLRHAIIDDQTAWIARAVGGPAGDGRRRRLLDIGCGPGLYCERFARLGFEVSGVDFNSHSLDYAREHAASEALDIEYVLGDYVELELSEELDVVTLINRDFGALTVPERSRLLAAVHRALRPGGVFVFDTLSTARMSAADTPLTATVMAEDGFWAAGPHLVLEETLLYPEARAELDRQVVVTSDGAAREFRNWLTYYTAADIRGLLRDAGFTVEIENPFLAAGEYAWPAGDLGFVARKASGKERSR